MTEINIETSAARRSRTAGIIWGMPKCGKTSFLLTLPGKKLFVMLDPDGDQSLPDREDVEILRLYEQPDDVIIRYLTANMPSMLRKNERGHDSVIFDSMSTLSTIALNDAIRNEVGASKKDSFKPSLEAPGLAAYGARTNHIIDIVNKNLRATALVGMHCWFTSHEDEPKTDDKGSFLYITMTLSGKAINGVGLNVSEIWHMRMMDKQWHLAIAPSRGKRPMGSRMFDVTGEPEFRLRFNLTDGPDQPHSIARWFQQWEESGRKKLPLPK